MQSAAPHAPPAAFAKGRFRVVRELGEGGLGRVFHVLDTETDVEVALKSLHALRPDQLFHLKQEFRSFADIDHPNIVALHELFVDQDEVFFTMELIDGVSFNDHLRMIQSSADSRGTVDTLHALEDALRQLMFGIGSLHRARRLHRDIKPSNVMVARNNRVVVLDFDMGLLLRANGDAPAEGGLVGTPEYMAPEQIWGFDVCAASDWFGVGVMLYEVMAGVLPHTGSLDELVVRKERGMPEPPMFAEWVPLELTELVRRLLWPSIATRAGESAIRTYLQRRGWPETALADVAGVDFEVPFVGRGRELALLQEGLAQVSLGHPFVVTIEGAAGIGKSDMVRHFLTTMTHNPRRATIVLAGRCHPRETVPFRALDSIIDTLSTVPDPIVREVFQSAGITSALLQLFPVLRRVMDGSEDGDEPFLAEPFEIRERAIEELRNVLACLATKVQTILWLDDLQWGDADSGHLLRELLRHANAPALLCILTYREGAVQSSPFLHALGEFNDQRASMSLGPLEPRETEQFGRQVAEVLGSNAEAIMNAVVVESHGHPLLLAELAHEFADATTSVQAVGALERIWQRRIAMLAESERRMLEIVAVAGRPLERQIVLRAAGIRDEGRGAFRRLSKMRLLSMAEANARPAMDTYHGRLREVLLAEMPVETKRARHLTVAECLRQTHAADPAALMVHYLAAGEERLAGALAVEAADRAAAAFAFDRAAELYALAIRLGANTRPRWELAKRMAEAFENDGRSRDAAHAYAQAARDARAALASSQVILDLRRRAAEQYLRCGYIQEGRWLIEDVLTSVNVPYPVSPLTALATVLVQRLRLWQRGLEPRSGVGDVSAEDRARIEACWSAGLGLAWVDRMRTAAFQSRYMIAALNSGDPAHAARALATEASQLASFGGERRSAESAALMQRAKQIAQNLKDPLTIAFTTLMAGTISFYEARWKETKEHCELAEQLLRRDCRGATWETTTSHLLRLAAMAMLGEMTKLARELPELVDEARRRGDKLAAASFASGVPNMVWLALDDPKEAQQQAMRAMADWPQTDFQTQHYFDLIARTQIELYIGQARQAWQRLRQAWPQLIWSLNLQVAHFRITLLHLRARAALASLTNRPMPNAFERAWLFRRAQWDRDSLAREHGPWPQALASLIAAGLASVEGHVDQGITQWRAAADLCDSLDMPLYAAAARWRMGTLLRGLAGKAARDDAEAVLTNHGVKHPARWVVMLAPAPDDETI